MEFLHYPVMNKEVVDLFRETTRTLFIDCTLGLGGHSYYLLRNFQEATVIGFDVDKSSIKRAEINLSEFGGRMVCLNSNFTSLMEKIEEPLDRISGILIDPGLSIYQIKDQDRGFSHSINSALDMRKDDSLSQTAGMVINTYSYKELKEIFEQYGEVKRAHELAKRIIEVRLSQSIDSTAELCSIIERLYHWKPEKGKLHPAAKVFQALRIYINRELIDLSKFLREVVPHLGAGCRVIILTYHSLEDRIVKKEFRRCRDRGILKIIKPFPMQPTRSEIEQNPPSRSAKLRAVEMV